MYIPKVYGKRMIFRVFLNIRKVGSICLQDSMFPKERITIEKTCHLVHMTLTLLGENLEETPLDDQTKWAVTFSRMVSRQSGTIMYMD